MRPRTKPVSLIRIWLLLLLIAVQLVGPLLHAHMGTPKQTGFHLDVPLLGLLDAVKAECAKDNDPCAGESEPFSVDVEKGIGHWAASLHLDPAHVQALLALFAAWLAPLVLLVVPFRSRAEPALPRWRGGSGRPPPAQAPPSHS